MSEAERLRLLRVALGGVRTWAELAHITRVEVLESTGYRRVWFMVASVDQPDELTMVDCVGSEADRLWNVVTKLKVTGDEILEAAILGHHPVVVADALTDPRTDKQIAERVGIRTLIWLPLDLATVPCGLLGTGTFGDEGQREPTALELAHLIQVAGHVAAAASRIMLTEAAAPRRPELPPTPAVEPPPMFWRSKTPADGDTSTVVNAPGTQTPVLLVPIRHRWPSLAAVRSVVLFVFGLVGLGWEIVFEHGGNPTLLILLGMMAGLPVFMTADEIRPKPPKDKP